MNRQDIVNTVAAHIRKQGRAATAADGTCRYRQRLPDGTVLMCAAGCLIPDSEYTTRIEGTSVIGGPVEYILMRAGVEPEAKAVLQALQSAHDKAAMEPPAEFLTFWEDRLRAVCDHWKLTYPEPQP